MRYFLKILGKVIGKYALPTKLDRVRRILVVDLNYIGDMLFSSPVYKALKDNLPNVTVDALVYPFTAEILSTNPYVDRIHSIPKTYLLRQLSTLFRLRAEKFDLVLQLNTSLRTNFLMWIIGGRYRLGYDYRNRGCFNNIRVSIPTRTAQTRYRIDECVELFEQAFGWKIIEREMIFPVTAEYKERVSELLHKCNVSASDLLVGIQSNCRETWKERRWEQTKFAALANELVNHYKAKVVFTGSKNDIDYVNAIMEKVKPQNEVISLVGKTTLLELAALFQRMDVFISVNTGPMQIAISQRTPTIALMGVTPPIVTYPMNIPIFQYVWTGSERTESQLKVDPKDSTLMKSIEVSDVLKKLDYLLELQKKNRLDQNIP
ncbi:MAG TPA: glycosyltransferase family 9 protein [Candidatus Acidoferrales bacterium]|nr:glycosyltransferase family 9 protein [Candidatus Acidoferrales bacterium]